VHTIRLKMGKMKKQSLGGFGGVALFVTLCLGLYAYGYRQKDFSYQEMKSRLSSLEQEKGALLAHQEELLLQIQSQSDPAWVEMVLKRNLGLVPKDQTKVYFKQD
jgi:hypothetical protein